MSRLYDGYEMRERHRQILSRNRPYLLHNMCVTEQLWATMIANELLSTEMVDECKTGLTGAEKIGKMLDMIPTRGPDAFDKFCEALLACDHAHVAERLKTLEATDQFAAEIKPHCVDVSDNLTEKFVSIFRKSTPSVQRFAERKFQIIMEEQDRDIAAKEEELRELQNQNMFLQLEVTQLRSHVNSCYETSENMVQEVRNKHVSRVFVREETEHLKNLKEQVKDIQGFEKIRQFYANTCELLAYLEKSRSTRDDNNNSAAAGSSSSSACALELRSRRAMSTRGKTMQDRMQMLIEQITNAAQRLGSKANVPGIMVKAEFEHVLKTFKDVVNDVLQIRDVFRNTMRQKRKMEGEVLSMLHNFQEIRRLEREMKEKQTHIADLGRQGTFMRKKTVNKQNRKQIEQIQQTIDQKRLQTREIQKSLERHISSADQRLHALLNLLPDLEDSGNEFLRSDTEMTSDVDSHAGSRLGTPLSISIRPTSAIFNKNTYRKLAETLGKRDDVNGGSAKSQDTLDARTSDSDDDKKRQQTDDATHKANSDKGGKNESESKPLQPTSMSNKPPRRTPQTLKPTLARSRAKDTSPAANRNKPTNVQSSSLDIDKWVEQERANERRRHNAQKPLTLSRVQMQSSSDPVTSSSNATAAGAPNMLPIKESHSERDLTNLITPTPSAPATSRQSQARRSVDYNSMKIGSKEHYHRTRQQRQSLTDFEHEKGYWETKNSSASSGGNRSSDIIERETVQTDLLSSSANKSSQGHDPAGAQRHTLVSFSRTNFDASEPDGNGSLSHRKRQQPSISPTDHNANVNFVEERTTELTHYARTSNQNKLTRSTYRDLNAKGDKAKPAASSSREVLRFNRIDLIGCLPVRLKGRKVDNKTISQANLRDSITHLLTDAWL